MHCDWSSLFSSQSSDTLKYRSKSKNYRRKLKEMENQSNTIISHHKDLERSLKDITVEHVTNQAKIGITLDRMEDRVRQIKNQRGGLRDKYEQRLDKALQEMH